MPQINLPVTLLLAVDSHDAEYLAQIHALFRQFLATSLTFPALLSDFGFVLEGAQVNSPAPVNDVTYTPAEIPDTPAEAPVVMPEMPPSAEMPIEGIVELVQPKPKRKKKSELEPSLNGAGH